MNDLVLWSESSAAVLLRREAVVLGERAADLLAERANVHGSQLTQPETEEVAMLLSEIRHARKALKDSESEPHKGPLWFLKQATEAVRRVTGPRYLSFDVAEATGKRLYEQWQIEQRRVALENERKARLEAEEAAKAAAADAEIMGEDAPPPFEVAPAEVPKAVRVAGPGSAMMTMKRNLVCRLVDASKCPPGLLELRTRAAQDLFRGAVAAGILTTPEGFNDGEGVVVYNGVEYRYEVSAVGRG